MSAKSAYQGKGKAARAKVLLDWYRQPNVTKTPQPEREKRNPHVKIKEGRKEKETLPLSTSEGRMFTWTIYVGFFNLE
jgi:hypothetical protein